MSVTQFCTIPGVKAFFPGTSGDKVTNLNIPDIFFKKVYPQPPCLDSSGIDHFSLNLRNVDLHPISYVRNLHWVM